MDDDKKKSALGMALMQEALHPDTLKGGEMAMLPGVKVKNGFINGFENEETPRPMVTFMKTMPAPQGRRRLLTDMTPQASPQGVSPVEQGQEQDATPPEDEEEQVAAGPAMQSWATMSSPTDDPQQYCTWGAPFGMAGQPAPAPVYTAAAVPQENEAQLRARVAELEAMMAAAQGGVPVAVAPPRTVVKAQAPVVAPAPPRATVQRQAVAQQPRVVTRVAPQRQVVVQQQAPARPAAVAPPAPSGVITPLPHRKPEMSVGASKHASGTCKPCAWFWKPQGCAHSSECGYCHMCPEGELKARKKDKANYMRDAAA